MQIRKENILFSYDLYRADFLLLHNGLILYRAKSISDLSRLLEKHHKIIIHSWEVNELIH
jgi:hypothetical protein